ncbi:exodeoxyribonuclease VII large subunit [Siculibacillus lacustris]|uniref:Exodeoxyribonuclease 7 large subunit n=1 Tax=Siculibacillus lacustris TaxID=1549641 RepID=A0A4Q9VQF5_9HYPH|nr:exodeoxyribonuclease VII large subunit [Siculibacillus lacustris]TBW37197.1 exodeoxyribonuclease VII large subunit [Siculibacillus lacustris]
MSDSATPNVVEFSVSELAQAVKRSIEDGFGHVRLRGEISGYRGPHSSGHAYFSLKDDGARIDAVVWRGSFGKLRFKPEEGMEVIATGRLTTFPGSSKYQIVIEALEPAGVGALMALLEARRKALAAEGLFDVARKRPLPRLPKVVGVVTSPTGAVIRDILHRIADRFPVRVIVWPVRVQGDTSAAEVAAAIAGFDALPEDGSGAVPRPDVVIVARGGGSLEDLWSFNEEIVVRAAAACRIPLISAIGHETDWTLLDHVADLRAPTPTGAAEMALPVRSELLDQVATFGVRLSGAARRGLESRRGELRSAARALPAGRNLIATAQQRFDLASGRLAHALETATRVHATRFARVSGRLSPTTLARAIATGGERLTRLGERAARAVEVALGRRRDRLDGAGKLLAVLSYRSVLARGFALVRDAEDRPVRAAAGVAVGAGLTLEFADGRLAVTAGAGPEGSGDAATGEARHAPRPQRRRPPGASQGSLF